MKDYKSSIIAFENKNKNRYLFDYDNKYISLAHPALVEEMMKSFSDEPLENEYYRIKADYLRTQGIGKAREKEIVDLKEDQIEFELENIGQIVFEVTDSCNLKCKYCGYGELYDNYNPRQNTKLEFHKIKPLLDFFETKWVTKSNLSANKPVFISFYGGEPLMNMPFIRKTVEYVKRHTFSNRTFIFSMTTNAMLLSQYMDFLAENEFHLLISLDGDRENHSYRVKVDGNNSFDAVISNIDGLRKKYPDYFVKHVNFNAVLHNKNSVGAIHCFIRDRYGKIPRIGELNTTGIRQDKQQDFLQMYRNQRESLYENENYEEIEKERFINASSYMEATKYVHNFTPFVFKRYEHLMANESHGNSCHKYIPTGTCLPFNKKMFVTATGNILACEKIGQEFSLGFVDEKGVELNTKKIAERYNTYLNKVKKQCEQCFRKQSCMQCIFNLKNINTDKNVVCHGFYNGKTMAAYCASIMTFFENHPSDYHRIMTEVVLY